MKRNKPEQRRALLKATGVAILGAPALIGSLGVSAAPAKSGVRRVASARVPILEGSPASAQKGAVAKLEPMASRRLHLVNEHTGDEFDVMYYINGRYVNENIFSLNHLMRDRRANIATNMDTTLFDQLFLLRSELGTDEPVHVLSGYRTPETNAKLRRRSKGVAKYSLHMEGRAVDIYIPGHSVKKVQRTALSLQAGGVGIYTKSNFVHMDTGQVRHWGS